MFGCIGDEVSGPSGPAVLWVVYSTQSPMLMRMTAGTAGAAIYGMELLALCLAFFWGAGSGFMGWGGLAFAFVLLSEK
jgi:hypothetical protein